MTAVYHHPPLTPAELDAIAQTQPACRRRGKGYDIPCPAPNHPGDRSGLNCNIAIGDSGNLIAYCHSHHCAFEDILAGLKIGEPQAHARPHHRTGRKPSTATTTAPPRQQAQTDHRQKQPKQAAARRPDWGAHQLPLDDTDAHSHSTACPQCEQPDTLIAWTLADHPFPYVGLALKCQCALSYDHLHKHVAKQIAAKGRQWRQEALYILADGHRRARIRIDPDKNIFWGGEKRNIKARQPLCWNHPRRGQPSDCSQILLVEGEKAAAAAVSAGIDNTHAVYSVGDAAGFSITNFTDFAGRTITLWPDADTAGIAAIAVAAKRLAPLAHRLALVYTHDLDDKADAADLIPQDVRTRIRTAREIT